MSIGEISRVVPAERVSHGWVSPTISDAAVRQQLHPTLQAQDVTPGARSTDLDPQGAKARVIDPTMGRLSSFVDDPIFTAIHGKWRDRQARSRLAYEAMYKHPVPHTAFKFLLAVLKCYQPKFKPSVRDPSDKQKEISDFAQVQLASLGVSGDARQGYNKLIDGFIGQGLEFGFSLSEMVTEIRRWRKKAMVQIKKVRVLPQASLDAGFIPREEFGDVMLNSVDPRYRCFKMDIDGEILAYYQFYKTTMTNDPMTQVSWEGNERKRILHFTHLGGDDNPFGESIFFGAYLPWTELFTREQLEAVFLDKALPLTVISYDAETTQPAFHKQVEELWQNYDPLNRILTARKVTPHLLTPTSDAFAKHITENKKELREQVTEAILVPKPTYGLASGTSNGDQRELIQVFFRFIVPSYLMEVAEVLQNQFARRLIDSNYNSLEPEDYPTVKFSFILDNDLRVAQQLITQILPLVDSARLGEVMSTILPWWESDWIPEDHNSSVQMQRGLTTTPGSGDGTPPTKQPGSDRQRMDGQTGNIGGETQTGV